MAAKPVTAGDLMRGVADELRTLKAWHAIRFAVLDQPFVFERPVGLSKENAKTKAFWAQHEHRIAMMQLLRRRASLRPTGPLTKSQMTALLGLVLKSYVPAFRPAKIVAAKGAPGRPPTALTERQKEAIAQAVAAGRSVRKACLRLAKDDEKKADALSAAWRRTTKRVRRK